MSGQEVVCQLERIVEDLETGANPPGTIAPAKVGEEIAKAFRVRPDEVAILVLVGAARHLQFLIPEKLKPVGTIPLTSKTALAARTARAKRPELINNFNIMPHASVFETVPLGRHPGEHIHRIMSAPISAEGSVLGVVQISRKGRSPEEAGPEFTPHDLRELVALGNVLAQLLKACKIS